MQEAYILCGPKIFYLKVIMISILEHCTFLVVTEQTRIPVTGWDTKIGPKIPFRFFVRNKGKKFQVYRLNSIIYREIHKSLANVTYTPEIFTWDNEFNKITGVRYLSNHGADEEESGTTSQCLERSHQFGPREEDPSGSHAPASMSHTMKLVPGDNDFISMPVNDKTSEALAPTVLFYRREVITPSADDCCSSV